MSLSAGFRHDPSEGLQPLPESRATLGNKKKNKG